MHTVPDSQQSPQLSCSPSPAAASSDSTASVSTFPCTQPLVSFWSQQCIIHVLPCSCTSPEKWRKINSSRNKINKQDLKKNNKKGLRSIQSTASSVLPVSLLIEFPLSSAPVLLEYLVSLVLLSHFLFIRLKYILLCSDF